MPSYATCHIFAATVQRVTSDAVAHIIDSAPSAYRWGAQGVSPLRMYHAPLPSPLHHAAAELRTQPPARLFEALCRAACAAHNTAALAYVFGFCTNYALSRVTSRFIDEQADRLATYMPGLSAAARRQLAASDIDGIMIEDYIDTASADYAAYRLLDADAPRMYRRRPCARAGGACNARYARLPCRRLPRHARYAAYSAACTWRRARAQQIAEARASARKERHGLLVYPAGGAACGGLCESRTSSVAEYKRRAHGIVRRSVRCRCSPCRFAPESGSRSIFPGQAA